MGQEAWKLGDEAGDRPRSLTTDMDITGSTANPATPESIVEAGAWVGPLKESMATVLVGQESMVDRLLVGLLCNGHLLLEGMPGLAKTHAVNALAACINARFRRIQFTPDLLPADLLGTMVFHPHSGEFKPRLGPVFANLVLADEINRAPAKVQSALLEAMQERQVTIGEESHRLPEPFLVLATQNPIEQEGTYNLPEAQLDRFLLKIVVPYPTKDEEKKILDLMASTEAVVRPRPVVDLEAVTTSRRLCNSIHLSAPVRDYSVDLVHATRDPGAADPSLRQLTRAGASPRATLNLARAARARAFLDARHFVTPDDVRAMAAEILRHRILLNFEAEAEGVTTDDVVARLLHRLPIP